MRTHKIAFTAAAVAASLVHAATSNWTSPTAGAWSNPANWSAGVPGPTDTGAFPTVTPNVTLDFSAGNITAGAVVSTIPATTGSNLSLLGTNSSTGSFVLTGATVTVPFTGPATETYSNVILASTDTSQTTNKNLNLNSGINLALPGANNVILGYRGAGNSATNNTGFPVISIAGNISNGSTTPAGITFLGGGNAGADGGELLLTGTNTFTGGLTVGSPDGTQGGEVQVNSSSSFPSTGTVTVYEQGQIAFAASATPYGSVGQTMVLNGIGIGSKISGAIRPTGGTAAAPVVYQGNIQLGSSALSDGYNGYVLLTVASGTSYFKVTGGFSGGGLLEQGGGTLELAGVNTYTGGTRIGNGAILVDSNSNLGPGELFLSQSSTNTPVITLNNAAQTVGSLRSDFFTNVAKTFAATGYTQAIVLNGTTLTLTQPTNSTFGYGSIAGLTSGLTDATALPTPPAGAAAGKVVINSPTNHTLVLSGPNTYTGGTTITAGVLSVANNVPGVSNPGSATGTGPVTVNAGGVLASGGYTAPIGFSGASQTTAIPVTAGTVSGTVNVAANGVVAPGGIGSVGSITVGGLNTASGAVFNFDINAATAGNYDTLIDNGVASVAGATINVAGSKFTFGTFNLISFASAPTGAFTLGSTPAGNGRSYALSTTPSGVVLTVTNTGTERIYSTNGSASFVDGPGTIANGTTNFFLSPGTPNSPYDNAANLDTIFGNGGTGGTITLGGSFRVGGAMILGPLSSGQSYTFAGPGPLTTVGGVVASNPATINAPVVLGGSQTYSTDAGITLSLNGGVSESTVGSSLTKAGTGTLVLGGTGSYTGGTNVSAGTLVTATAALPTAGGVANAGVLDFDQANPGTYAGLISGPGSVTINNAGLGNAGAVTLSNAANSYSGITLLTAGTLVVPSTGVLGTGNLVLNGGTLQAGGNLSFAATSPNRTVTLAQQTTSTINTAWFNVSFGQNIAGAGNLNVTGGGTLNLLGFPTTTVIGQVAVAPNTNLVIAPATSQPSVGFSFANTDGTVPGNIVIATSVELRLYGGNLTGGGNLVIQPSGVLTVSRGTTVIGNTIVLNPANVPGASYSFGSNTAATLAINGPITGNASVQFTGGNGVVTLAGQSTYAGSTRVDAPVVLGANNPLPTTTDVSVTGGGSVLLDLAGYNLTVGSISATSATATVTNSSPVNNSTLSLIGPAVTTFAGLVQDATFGGTLGITMNGSGSVALSTLSSYSGPTTILNGRFDVSGLDPDTSTSALGATGSIYVSNGQLRFTGVNGTPSFLTAAHPFATVPTITLDGIGGYNTDSGAIRVAGSSALILPNNVVFNSTSSITATNSSSLTLAGNLSGGGTFVSNGVGIINVTGTNTLTGGTEIDAGTFNVAAGSSIGTGPLAVNNTVLNASGVVLNFNSAAPKVGSLSGSVLAPNTAAINLSATTVLTITQTTASTYAGTLTGAGSVVKAGVASLTIGGGESFTGSLNVSAGALTVAPNPGTGIYAQTQSAVSVATGATLALAASPVHANRTVLVTPNLTDNGTIDLANNDLIVKTGNLSSVVALFRQGGLVSSSAAGDTTHTTTLGIVQNGPSPFDGVSINATDVLVKYTYFGDANLDGKVDGSDYSRIDVGHIGQLPGWSNGDFNYDGRVDASDYSLIDNAYNRQSVNLTVAALVSASPTAAVPEPVSAGLLASVACLGLRRRKPGKTGHSTRSLVVA